MGFAGGETRSPPKPKSRVAQSVTARPAHNETSSVLDIHMCKLTVII